MNLEGAVRRAYSRRSFLLGAVSATSAGVLAACSQPSQPAATTAPAAQPTAAAAAPTKPPTRTDAPPVPANVVSAAKQYSGQKVVYYGDGVGPAGAMEHAAIDQFNKDTGINVVFTQR